MKKIEKWTAITSYVDLDTGEIIKEYSNEYRIIKTKKINKIHKKLVYENGTGRVRWYGVTEYVNECRRNEYRQCEIW